MPDLTDGGVNVRLIDRIYEAKSFFDLQRAAHAIAVEKGWHDGYNPERDFSYGCMMAVTEICEAVQAHQKGLDRSAVAEELADTVIRLMDTAATLDIDLEDAVRQKMVRNIARPIRHGGLPY